MKTFSGFQPGKYRKVEFYAPFFSELLPLIDDLAELKVTLFCFWALPQKEDKFRYLRRRDFSSDPALMEGLAAVDPQADPHALLDAALLRAVERGSLLRAEIKLDSGAETLYFVNSAAGRTAVTQITDGDWKPGDLDNPVEILPERPNIYALYEANVGPLTPMIADALKDAEKTYPPAWISEAIQVSVEQNKRSWRYIQAVLKRWETEGRSREITGRDNRGDEQGYVSGEYADFIQH